jgi:hypothetical protein
MTLPSLDPPVPINDIVGRYLLDARRATRVDRAKILTALDQSRRTGQATVTATMWAGGVCATFAGTAERPGLGREFTCPLHVHAALLRNEAQIVTGKGCGYARTLGRSRSRGSSNREFDARTGIFLDCDECGTASRLLAILDELGIAYLYQARLGGLRWHIELFFAEDLRRPESAVTDEDLKLWVDGWYRPAMGWLLGVFSELGELDCKLDPHEGRISISKLGADGASANRLLALGNPYARRTDDEPEPETDYREGARIDVGTLLALTGFRPPTVPEGTPRRRTPRSTDPVPAATVHTSTGDALSGDGDGDGDDEAADAPDAEGFDAKTESSLGLREPLRTAVVRAYEAAGLLLIDLGRHAIVRCPFGDGHSTGTDGDTSTVILPNGYVKCMHGSCGDRRPGDFLTALPSEAGFAFVGLLPEILAADDDALFLPSTLALAAHLSVVDPLRFAEHLRRLPVAARTLWMDFVRKERRS